MAAHSPQEHSAASAATTSFRALGAELRNWGRWGADDRRGTLNHIDDAARAYAASLVRTGQLVNLGLELNEHGPQGPYSERNNPLHEMTRTGTVAPLGDGYIYTDDRLTLDLQSGTQLDGLAHVAYDGRLYNDLPLDSVTERGSELLGIQELQGIQGRGILLDLPRYFGIDRLEADRVVGIADLEACARMQHLEVRAGDIVLIRTGWIQTFFDGDGEQYLTREPGLALDTARWLHANDIALLASDNFGIEVVPAEQPGDIFPLHCVLIRDMGMPLGEILVLDELAQLCAAEQRWEFLFTCLPLPVTGGVGSPITPIATF